jgi:hypothetical protein
MYLLVACIIEAVEPSTNYSCAAIRVASVLSGVCLERCVAGQPTTTMDWATAPRNVAVRLILQQQPHAPRGAIDAVLKRHGGRAGRQTGRRAGGPGWMSHNTHYSVASTTLVAKQANTKGATALAI